LLQSTISLRNVFISRRPSGHSYNSTSSFDAVHQLVDENGEAILPAPESSSAEGEEEEDTNYSMFDLNVDSIDVTLNFMSWLNGDGLVKKAVVRGVRGVVGSLIFLSFCP
jgi:distribution and morphology protein 31